MDYPLGGRRNKTTRDNGLCLNPYSNGLPSRGLREVNLSEADLSVLIPILMDYPLGDENRHTVLEHVSVS